MRTTLEARILITSLFLLGNLLPVLVWAQDENSAYIINEVTATSDSGGMSSDASGSSYSSIDVRTEANEKVYEYHFATTAPGTYRKEIIIDNDVSGSYSAQNRETRENSIRETPPVPQDDETNITTATSSTEVRTEHAEATATNYRTDPFRISAVFRWVQNLFTSIFTHVRFN